MTKKSKEPEWEYRSMNAAAKKAVPMCVIMIYIIPAWMDFSCVESKTTRKYDTRDMISQTIKKMNALPTVTNKAIERTKTKSSSQESVIFPEEYPPFK